MRWFWIDRFLEFEHGRRAVSEKCVTLAEEHVYDYHPYFPCLPGSLIIEGLAQTGGLLVGEYNAFRERVVLAKVAKAKFHDYAYAGDTLRYTCVVEQIQPDGAIVRGSSQVDGKLQAEVELLFAHLDDRFEGVDMFYPADFLGMLRIFRLYEVGKMPDGSPLEIPAELLEAEQRAITSGTK